MNKTIEINPSLFHVNGKNKTPKNKSIKNKPIINPNVLKHKFLKRIKQHKSDELKNQLNSGAATIKEPDKNEFEESIKYLQELSKETKKNNERSLKRDNLEKKTVKNYTPVFTPPSTNNHTDIRIDLPDELKEYTPTPILREPAPIVKPIVQTPASVKVHNQVLTDVPYGILKGGNKPTYRAWNTTHKNRPQDFKINNLFLNSTMIPPEITEREDKLNKLKNKIQEKHAAISNNNIKPAPDSNRMIKTTITKKYTLGKSKLKRKIGVLIKNRETRKNIIMAHRDLKHISMNDVRLYLNEHNLTKLGSKSPNDVLRKMYEAAKLTGDVSNLNNNILLHNITKSEHF
uniref:Uncharacterized protein n=1 Tax=viral metagenome TaxID=1070528 RepID=A0A6C0LKH9_9ZZZZ